MPKQREFQEIFDINPVLLHKKDLFELENILIENAETDKIDIQLKYNNTTIPADSFEDLFSNADLPDSTDKLSVAMTRRAKKEDYIGFPCGVNLSMHYNHVNCLVYSVDNTWFLGKKAQIKSFFRKKKPWYAFLISVSTSLPALSILFLFYSAYLFAKKQFIEMILPIASFLIILISTAFIFKQKIFPYVKVNLHDKPKFKFGFNELCVLIGALAGIATIIQILSNMFN